MGIPRENSSSNWYEDNNEIGMVLEFKTVYSNYFTCLISHFLFVTFFSLIFGGLRIRVNVTTLPPQSHDKVIVTVTQSHVIGKSVEDSGRMMLYSTY